MKIQSKTWHRIVFITGVISIILIMAVGGTGCVSLSDKYYEPTWQALNLIDTGQSIHTARTPECYHEEWSKDIVGEHPSESSMYAMMAGYALSHYYINRWLDAKAEADGGAWWGVSKFFQASTLLISGRNIINNKRIGLTPWGSGCRASTPPPTYYPDAKPVM